MFSLNQALGIQDLIPLKDNKKYLGGDEEWEEKNTRSKNSKQKKNLCFYNVIILCIGYILLKTKDLLVESSLTKLFHQLKIPVKWDYIQDTVPIPGVLPTLSKATLTFLSPEMSRLGK